MGKWLRAQGAAGVVSLTITGEAKRLIEVYGVVCGTDDAGSMTSVPKVVISNVQYADGTVADYVITPEEGGATANLARGIVHTPPALYKKIIPQGLSTIITYTSGPVTGAPSLHVCFTRTLPGV